MGLLRPSQDAPPMPEQGMQQPPAEPMPDEQAMQGDMAAEEPAENDPAYVAARQWILDKLYSGDMAADDTVSVAQSGPNPMPLLVDMAYTLAGKADEATDGQILEENLVSLGAIALGEVLQVAKEVGGAEIEPAAMANGLNQMVIRFLQESGVDTSQIEAAMSQVDPQMINQLVQQAEQPQQAGME